MEEKTKTAMRKAVTETLKKVREGNSKSKVKSQKKWM